MMAAIGALGLGYVYGGYLLLLRLVSAMRGATAPKPPLAAPDADLPGVTVFFSAYNEEALIERRLDDLARQDYPRDRLEILVVSDGSTDGTVAKAEAWARTHPDLGVRVVALPVNQGRHASQNLAWREARHDILVTTDADSEFAPGFLRAMGAALTDPTVGAAGGIIAYRESGSSIARSIGSYRGMEYRLRAAEQALGILVKTDGPCTAYRRGIWREIEEFEDVDHVIVIFARQAGLRAVQVREAVVYDTPNSHWRQEMRARARMTRKGLLSIHKNWRWRDIVVQPGFSLALYSHRHCRYLSPVFSFLLIAGLAGYAVEAGPWRESLVALGLVIGLATTVPFGRRLLRRVGSFAAANAGFGLGLFLWLRGDRSGRYIPSRKHA